MPIRPAIAARGVFTGRTHLVDGAFGVGPESEDTQLFLEDEIPWKELAFPVVYETLKEYFQDRKDQHYPVRVGGIDPSWFKSRVLKPKA